MLMSVTQRRVCHMCSPHGTETLYDTARRWQPLTPPPTGWVQLLVRGGEDWCVCLCFWACCVAAHLSGPARSAPARRWCSVWACAARCVTECVSAHPGTPSPPGEPNWWLCVARRRIYDNVICTLRETYCWVNWYWTNKRRWQWHTSPAWFHP